MLLCILLFDGVQYPLALAVTRHSACDLWGRKEVNHMVSIKQSRGIRMFNADNS
jgi:hypothetical protein